MRCLTRVVVGSWCVWIVFGDVGKRRWGWYR